MYDLAIIGGGAAGIACAKQAIKNNLKIALITKSQEQIGGTCLNQGCIPTKFFINAAKKRLSWQEAFLKNQEIQQNIKNSLLKYFQAQKTAVLFGNACFLDQHSLSVNGQVVQAKNIIIATGSKPQSIDNQYDVVSAESIFKLNSLPDKILIIGAGYIGVEFAAMLNAFGLDVLLVEREKNILPFFKTSLNRRLELLFKKKGIEILTSKDFNQINLKDFGLILTALGRRADLDSLGVDKVNLALDHKGYIITDNHLRTNLENIFACGDVTGKKQLAYVAQHQAQVCVDNILGTDISEDYFALPECVFSLPQLARVGMSQEEAKKQGVFSCVIKSNFLKFSSAYVYDDEDGYLQVVLSKDNKILGVEILSNFAAELANIFSLAIRKDLTVDDFKKSCFIHPTISEIIPLLFK